MNNIYFQKNKELQINILLTMYKITQVDYDYILNIRIGILNANQKLI